MTDGSYQPVVSAAEMFLALSNYAECESMIPAGPHRILFSRGGEMRFGHRCRFIGKYGVLYQAPRLGADCRLISVEPLTIESVIQCDECGTRGFVREGEWTDDSVSK